MDQYYLMYSETKNKKKNKFLIFIIIKIIYKVNKNKFTSLSSLALTNISNIEFHCVLTFKITILSEILAALYCALNFSRCCNEALILTIRVLSVSEFDLASHPLTLCCLIFNSRECDSLFRLYHLN